MNLTGRPVYQKCSKSKKSNNANKAQKERFDKLAKMGCVINNHECCNHIQIHHIETGMGRQKKHDETIPLCFSHHQGKHGIHTLGKKEWARRYDTERAYLVKVNQLLNKPLHI